MIGSSTVTKNSSALGAPLRNRTVDLLLTMGSQHVAVSPLSHRPGRTRAHTSRREPCQAMAGGILPHGLPHGVIGSSHERCGGSTG
jgi:hypothetical protein